jgi:REP element-mobilizing transposase RayT
LSVQCQLAFGPTLGTRKSSSGVTRTTFPVRSLRPNETWDRPANTIRVPPRRKRSYQPGGAFHITARTNGKEHWLDDNVRGALVGIIAMSIARTDARLIAFAIMSNHFHLVLWQGFMTLGQVVQPITRRLALLLARKLGRGGRLLERRYYDVQCVDAEHLREASPSKGKTAIRVPPKREERREAATTG